jgi:hypothetical protein
MIKMDKNQVGSMNQAGYRTPVPGVRSPEQMRSEYGGASLHTLFTSYWEILKVSKKSVCFN